MPPQASTSGFELGSSLFHQQDRDAFISQIKQNQVFFAVSCWNTLIWWNWNVLPKLIGLNKTPGGPVSCFSDPERSALCRGQFTLQWPEPAPLLPRRCSAHHTVSALGGVISLSLFMRTFETPQLYQCGLRPNTKEISEFLFLTALRRKQ